MMPNSVIGKKVFTEIKEPLVQAVMQDVGEKLVLEVSNQVNKMQETFLLKMEQWKEHLQEQIKEEVNIQINNKNNPDKVDDVDIVADTHLNHGGEDGEPRESEKGV